jgi:hypothetical protein
MTRSPPRLRPAVLAAALAAAGLPAAAPAAAQELAAPERTEVDLELVLAVDISRSMDYDEQLIQRDGYVAAFRDERVARAMTGGYHSRIAVTYLEWANEYTQQQTLPWTLIETEEDAAAFAAAMDAADLVSARGTSISGALQAAANLINSNDYQGLRRVIDISGDGSNRDGPAVGPIRDAVAASGITINGLPLILRPSGGGRFGGGGFGGGGGRYGYEVEDLEAYYRAEVIAGPGAFVLPVRDVSELPASIRQKLILEIAGEPYLGPWALLEGSGTAAE